MLRLTDGAGRMTGTVSCVYMYACVYDSVCACACVCVIYVYSKLTLGSKWSLVSSTTREGYLVILDSRHYLTHYTLPCFQGLRDGDIIMMFS